MDARTFERLSPREHLEIAARFVAVDDTSRATTHLLAALLKTTNPTIAK